MYILTAISVLVLGESNIVGVVVGEIIVGKRGRVERESSGALLKGSKVEPAKWGSF